MPVFDPRKEHVTKESRVEVLELPEEGTWRFQLVVENEKRERSEPAFWDVTVKRRFGPLDPIR